MNVIEALPWLIVIGLGAYFAPEVVLTVGCYLSAAMAAAAQHLDGLLDSSRRPAAEWLRRIEEKTRRNTLRHWINRMIDEDESDEALDRDVLLAQKEAPRIRRLIEIELPKAISRCVRIHRLAALAVGAEFISEVAATPECFRLRLAVVTLQDGLGLKLDEYAFLLEDETLLRNRVVIRRMRGICGRCPYLAHRAFDAPPLCPTAELAGIEEPHTQTSGRNAI